MDIQFIGAKSNFLINHITKYIVKPIKSNYVDTFDIINSTKSLHSALWNISQRALNHRECGALEAADTLIGMPLYSTDPSTTIRWVDVNTIRNRKVKPRKEIEQLEKDSEDIFYPSFIDTYYQTRPKDLNSMHLYDLARWYDVTRVKPAKMEIYEIGDKLYLKKRKRPYFINHYRYNVDLETEKYYFSLLLLFKP